MYSALISKPVERFLPFASIQYLLRQLCTVVSLTSLAVVTLFLVALFNSKGLSFSSNASGVLTLLRLSSTRLRPQMLVMRTSRESSCTCLLASYKPSSNSHIPTFKALARLQTLSKEGFLTPRSIILI